MTVILKVDPAFQDLIADGYRCIGCDKSLYTSPERAQAAADRNTLRYGPMWSHRCRYGLGWHLTTLPPDDARFPKPTGTRQTRRVQEKRRRQRLRQRLGVVHPDHTDAGGQP